MIYASIFNVLATTSHSEDMRRRLTAKLHRMTTLRKGWSHGEGLPVSWNAVLLAEGFVRRAAYVDVVADVFPNLDGGCAVAFYRGEVRVEVSISPSEQMDLRIEQGIGLNFKNVIEPRENVKQEEVDACIVWLIQDDQWKLSGSSTYASSTELAFGFATCSIETPSIKVQRPLQTAAGGSQSSKSLVHAAPA